VSIRPPIERPTQSIDEVIESLTRIIDWAGVSHSRLGYFASLYRKVTVQVRDHIENGKFENVERMERFDVIFANRYFQALIDLRTGRAPAQVWTYAFESADSYWPIVLQHLLLGMNAHINLDLGIAAAETMKGQQLSDLQKDFNKINDILAGLVGEVQTELAKIWMTLRLFTGALGSVDDALIRFSMNKARDEAWQTAERFWNLPETEWPSAIRAQDVRMVPLAGLIRQPGLLLGTVTRIVRLGEVQDVAKVVGLLSGL
jgi:hypothetical protein